MSVTQIEITQARQDRAAVHGTAIRASERCITFCAFRLFSDDNKEAM